MRLIDADSIRFKPYYDEYVDYDGYINDLKTWQLDDILSDRVDNTPTVMAIPIEWIKKKSLEFLMNRNFRWATDFQEVIDMWKVENNIPLFDDELKITLEKENQSLE